jgi:beta-galactosidase
MTAKRETAGPAAKLVLTADRTEISGDGEDVAMLAVEDFGWRFHFGHAADGIRTMKVLGRNMAWLLKKLGS